MVFGDTSIVNYAGFLDCCKNGLFRAKGRPGGTSSMPPMGKEDYFLAWRVITVR